MTDARGMLVAAGFGTRLSPLTDELPKPAVPVGNRPLATYALEHLAAAGIADVVVNTHHLAVELERALSGWSTASAPKGVRLSFVREPEILGTGGGVRNAWREPERGPFVVMNGKLLFRPDLARLLSTHAATDALVTLVLGPMPEGQPFGPVDIADQGDDSGPVRAVLQPVLAPGLRRCFFTGVYVLHPRAHARLPERGCLIRQGIVPWIAAGERVMAVVDRHPFVDAGRSIPHYFDANMDLLQGRLAWPGLVPDASARSLVALDAQIAEGCALDSVAIGPGARVGARRLERVVVWPGAHVDLDVTDAIVTGRGQIVSLRRPSDTARP